jgi:outer membrane receptor protein involved in Fe transport
MSRSFLLAFTALPAILFFTGSAQADVETVVVTAQKLVAARESIQTQVGASTYTITADDIQAQPGGGENNGLNQVILQAPGVAEDSFGQLHVRAEHAEIQYRVNGVIIPEGIAVFSQTLNPRLAHSVKLIDGSLPAEYGLRTAAIIDIQTKSGLFDEGGQVGVYGGSHSEYEPSFDYGGSTGNLNYFVSGDYLTDTLGIESPDGRVDPLHDRTKQWHGFGYAQDILDAHSSITAIFGTSNSKFQIPNQRGQIPGGISGVDGLCHPPPSPGGFLEVNGVCDFASEALDDNQTEITHFATLSYLRTDGPFDFQAAIYGRYSSLLFVPKAFSGDILFTGLAQRAYKRDVAYGGQIEGAYHLGDEHTLRAGAIYQADDLASRASTLTLLVADPNNVPPPPAFPAGGCPPPGTEPAGTVCQTSDTPFLVVDNSSKHAWSYSLYLQDEWKVLENLTLNFGVRWDQFGAFTKAGQLSPRINAVWKPTPDTTVHIGYSKYFTPPPIELIANTDIALLINPPGKPPFVSTTAAPGCAPTPQTAACATDTPKAERADYYDFGVLQNVGDGFTVGVDSFFKLDHDLIDEGQFGAPIILTPFNYAAGRQYGLELTGTYEGGPLRMYVNAAYERGVGRHIISSEFNFTPDALAFISTHFIPLDHQQLGSISAGASYLLWERTRISADMLFGTGLRATSPGGTPNGAHVPAHTVVNLGLSHTFDFGDFGGLTARFDVVNLFDETYQLRNGTGVGVGEPQFGARRGFFMGLSKPL